MNPESIQSLAEAVKEYYSQYELEDLCSQYGIEVEYKGLAPNYLQVVKSVVSDLNTASHRRFLDELLTDMRNRCEERIRISSKEDQLYHEQMFPLFEQFRGMLQVTHTKPVKTRQAAAGLTFNFRGEVSTFIGRAKTDVTLVDPQLGIVTLDCLRNVSGLTRILSAASPDMPDENFRKALAALRAAGRRFELRRNEKLNDRLILFDNRCWALSNSLKDAGTAAITLVEIIDARSVVNDFIERKWAKSSVVPE